MAERKVIHVEPGGEVERLLRLVGDEPVSVESGGKRFKIERERKELLEDYDPAKAEEILTGLGFERDSDNVWMDENGERLEFEFLFQAEFADWSAAAKNACEQLTVFGIKCTGRSITWGQLAQAFGQIVLLLGGIIGGIGIAVFNRRELATAQGNQ